MIIQIKIIHQCPQTDLLYPSLFHFVLPAKGITLNEHLLPVLHSFIIRTEYHRFVSHPLYKRHGVSKLFNVVFESVKNNQRLFSLVVKFIIKPSYYILHIIDKFLHFRVLYIIERATLPILSLMTEFGCIFPEHDVRLVVPYQVIKVLVFGFWKPNLNFSCYKFQTLLFG